MSAITMWQIYTLWQEAAGEKKNSKPRDKCKALSLHLGGEGWEPLQPLMRSIWRAAEMEMQPQDPGEARRKDLSLSHRSEWALCNRAGAEWRRSAGSTFSTLTLTFQERNLSLRQPHLIFPHILHSSTCWHAKIKSKCADAFSYWTLRTHLRNAQIRWIFSSFLFSRKRHGILFKPDEIPHISSHLKHNAALMFWDKAGPLVFSGVWPHTPFIFNILTYFFTVSQPPLLLLCETNSSFITEWGPQLPLLFRGTERRGDTA